MFKFPDYIKTLVDAGVEVTLAKNDKLGYYLDLNLNAKSHLHLFMRDDKYYVDMRYDEQHEIKDFADLLWQARRGMHGRDYVSSYWSCVLAADARGEFNNQLD